MTMSLKRVLVRAGVLVGFVPAALAAQQTTITGHVLNEANGPLEAVRVSIASLLVGANTGADGRYTFTVPAAQSGKTVSIVARRIGYEPRTVVVTLNGATMTQDFQLNPAPVSLNAVVTTALGQQVEKSKLGTAQQEVSSELLNTTFDPNVVNQLEGKVSGVNIVGSGTQGGSTNITIRGYTSITGSNQPLFIVDGVPVSNNDRGSSQNGGGMVGSKDFGSVIQDINPDDIASLTVLKGPNAAALYGSRAANGVILITTKRGAGNVPAMQFSSSVTFDRPSRLPDFQNQYGQGSAGQFKWVNGLGALDGNDQSYGPKLDGRLIDQFTGPQQPWVAHPDNVSSFFNTGRTEDANFSISGGTERASARLSVSGENVDGIIPNSFLRRLGGVASGTLQASDKLSLNGSVDYVRNDGVNRPGQGYVGGIVEGLYVWFGRQVDMQALKNNWMKSASMNNGPSNREFNWNYSYHNNPYFMQYDNPEQDQRDRVIATGSATYKFTDWLSATARSGTDTYRYNISANYAEGNIELNNGSNTVNPAYAGAFTQVGDQYTENNTEVLLNGVHNLFSNLSLNATAGANRRYSQYNQASVVVNGITVAGTYNVANAGLPPVNAQTITNQAVNSVYGSAALTWNGWWTVEGTARNDWSSTLPPGQNSYFYPSVSTSIVLTDAIPALRNRSVLTFLKLRGGTARVGNDAPPYSLYTTYVGNASKFDGLSLFSLGNQLLNPNLKPETTHSNEGGVEMGFWGGRVSVDASIYDKFTTDEITALALPSSTGYASKLVNAGKIDNKGFEALLNIEPVHNDRWSWNTTFNFSRNRGRVVSLYPGLESIVFGQFQGSVDVEARPGQPLGTIRGYTIKRDASGKPLLDDIGEFEPSDTLSVLGNIQPDWLGGWVNSVRYKALTLTTTLDMRHGGKIFSGTNFYGTATGVLKSTLHGREVDWNNPGIVINGIIESTGQPNTQTITTEQYWQSLAYNSIAEPYVYDDSFIKLREVRLGYDVPARWASKLSANSVNVALVGRNLWTHTNVPNIDPEVTYNTGSNQGIEYGALPAARSMGFAVRITP
jgi:TonB-linked SusC/RagA family outer membrane protein